MIRKVLSWFFSTHLRLNVWGMIVVTCAHGVGWANAQDGSIFGELPRNSMSPPDNMPEDIAERLLYGDLSKSTSEGEQALLPGPSTLNVEEEIRRRAATLSAIAESAKSTPAIVFPDEVVNPK